MNKYFYRVVFNRVRGMLMVVSEITKNHQGNARSSQKVKSVHKLSNKAFTLKPMVFMSYLALGLVSVITPSYAGTIIVDKNAENHQRPIIAQTDKGATQVNIAAPNKNGVSHNKYNQFDVDKNGVILNNTKSDSRSRLGGNIKGNALLQETGSAKIILNEVNSKDPSKLNGYIEVAGKKAQVIIANPAGITCDGCSFINADRATLTTGKALFENDQLVGYRVEGGNITITGDGLDSSAQDYTDIIARSVNVNAELWASDLKVITGLNEVTVDGIVTQSVQSEEAPEFAIDVSALGGMYAGKIELIGTESGVGVHNAGQLGASAGGLTITADGKIVNSGTIKVEKDIVLNADSLNNNGNILSENNLTLKAQEIINKNSKIVADGNVTIESDNIKNVDTIIRAGNVLNIHAKIKIDNSKSNLFGYKVLFEATEMDNYNTSLKGTSSISMKNVILKNNLSTITSQNLNIDSQLFTNVKTHLDGTIIKLNSIYLENNDSNITSEEILLKAAQVFNKNTTLHSYRDLKITGKSIDNTSSVIASSGYITITGERINNRNTEIFSKKDIIINADSLDNSFAKMKSEHMIDIASNDVINSNAEILAENNLSIKAKTIKNDDTKLIAGNIFIKANKLIGNGDLKSYNDLKLDLQSSFINQANIEADGELKIISLDNIKNYGLITGKKLALSGLTITNDENAMLNANTILISGETLNNYGIINGNNVKLELKQDLNNYKMGRSGIFSQGHMFIKATTVNNYPNAIISTTGYLLIDAQTLNNYYGRISASEYDLKVGEFNNYIKYTD